MLFLTQSAAVYGIDALLVDIEVNLQPVKGEIDNAPSVLIVGLPDTAIRESRERIRAAITNSSYFFPFHKTTINLAPADVRKEGASFDLPIALGILGANGDLGNSQSLENTLSVAKIVETDSCLSFASQYSCPTSKAQSNSEVFQPPAVLPFLTIL